MVPSTHPPTLTHYIGRPGHIYYLGHGPDWNKCRGDAAGVPIPSARAEYARERRYYGWRNAKRNRLPGVGGIISANVADK